MSKSNATHFTALAANELLCKSKHLLLVAIGTCSILFVPFSPASAFQLTFARNPNGELPVIDNNLFKTKLFGETLPSDYKDGFSLDMPKPTSDYAIRYGCPPANTCNYEFQYKVQDIVWPKATFTNFINIVPSGEYVYGNAVDPPVRATYDSSYVLEHEEVHLNQDYSFLTKHFQSLVDWAAGYIGDWFNSIAAAMQALQNDFDVNYNAALNDATPEFYALFAASTHDPPPGNGTLTDYDTDGNLMLYPPQDPADPWTYQLRDVDEVWRTNMDDLIASYTPAYDLVTTPGEEPIPCVPGPLPVLGIGCFFAYSRRLRTRIKKSKSN
jgi:hypothetical protein